MRLIAYTLAIAFTFLIPLEFNSSNHSGDTTGFMVDTELLPYIEAPQHQEFVNLASIPIKKETQAVEHENKSIEALMSEAGIPSEHFSSFLYIFGQESGFCFTKWEGQRHCPATYIEQYSPTRHVGYGFCQATPAIKYEEAGKDWRTNPITQLKWCYNYALSYGSVDAAVRFKKCIGKCYSTRTKTTPYKVTPWF